MANYLTSEISKVTTNHLIKMKRNNEKIAILTAYDFTTARILDGAGIDAILIGDSAANVMAGYNTTVPISLDHMIMYAASVVRGVKRALVICDMPFGTYTNPTDGVKNAICVMQETQCDALKLEGGVEIIDTIKAILNAGIPVMGHLGLTPQSINKFGTYAVRAKEEQEAEKLVSDAHTLEEAGCFGIVLEKIPATLSAKVSSEIAIPTIGIGGGMCDGQVLVVDDMMGKNKGFKPKFLRVYADLHQVMTDAASRYIADVKSMDFPNVNESY
jgi:3-methyl-2-oxobutanoate hydroxymethyltransferase